MHPSKRRVVAWIVGLAMLLLAVVGYVQATQRLDAAALKTTRYLEKNPQTIPGWADVVRVAPVTPESTIRFGAPKDRQWIRANPPEAAYDGVVTIVNGATTKRYRLTVFVYLTRQGDRSDFFLISPAGLPWYPRTD